MTYDTTSLDTTVVGDRCTLGGRRASLALPACHALLAHYRRPGVKGSLDARKGLCDASTPAAPDAHK